MKIDNILGACNQLAATEPLSVGCAPAVADAASFSNRQQQPSAGGEVVARRTVLAALSAAGLVALAPRPADAMAPLIFIMLPTLAAGLFGLLAAKRGEDIQLRIEASRLEQQRATIALQSGDIEAYKFSMRRANWLLTGDVDGFGTVLTVDRGNVCVECGGRGAALTGGEMKVMQPIYEQPGMSVPVPIEEYSPRVEPVQAKNALAQIQHTMGLSAAAFNEKYSPLEARRVVTQQKGQAPTTLLSVIARGNQHVNIDGQARTPIHTFLATG